jgi:hypothetical protein
VRFTDLPGVAISHSNYKTTSLERHLILVGAVSKSEIANIISLVSYFNFSESHLNIFSINENKFSAN